MPVPEPLGVVLTELVRAGRSHTGTGSPATTPWLFHGGLPGRPITAGRLASACATSASSPGQAAAPRSPIWPPATRRRPRRPPPPGPGTAAKMTERARGPVSVPWTGEDVGLTLTAVTNKPSDTLQVVVQGTNQLIGTMTNLARAITRGSSRGVNPGYVEIKSSGGATSAIPITTVNQ